MGVLGEDTPDKLRETVLFLLGIQLALKAGDEHYDLPHSSAEKSSKLSFKCDQNSGKAVWFIKRIPSLNLTMEGWLANLKKEHKIVWVFLSSDINSCSIRLVDKYISLCPEVGKRCKT